jgi:hypothetical protein
MGRTTPFRTTGYRNCRLKGSYLLGSKGTPNAKRQPLLLRKKERRRTEASETRKHQKQESIRNKKASETRKHQKQESIRNKKASESIWRDADLLGGGEQVDDG